MTPDDVSPATFNNPLEAGLRVLTLLVESFPEPMDLQKLVYLDFLAVHSGDAGGPESLHPPTPHRAAEIVVRRRLIESGALLFASRGLIQRVTDQSGFSFVATESAGPFLSALNAGYTLRLRSRASWVLEEFGGLTTTEIETYFAEHLDRWGGEFALASRHEDES